MTLFSIVVPVHSPYKEYLPSCIQSVLSQTYTGLELILVSSDHECDALFPTDQRIRLFYVDDPNVSRKRNKGIEQAGGKYILFLDCDDELAPATLEQLLFSCEEANDPDILFFQHTRNSESLGEITGNDEFINSNSQILSRVYAKTMKSPEQDDLFLSNSSCGKSWRTVLIQQYGILFPDPPTRAEDAVFVGQALLHANRSVFVHHRLYYYRQHQSSTVHSFSKYWLDLEGYLIRIQPVLQQIDGYSDKAFSDWAYNQFLYQVSCLFRAKQQGSITAKECMFDLKLLYREKGSLLFGIVKAHPARSFKEWVLKHRRFFLFFAGVYRV